MKNYLDERFLGVISTVSKDSKPESAYVGYSCNDRFELIIGTSRNSRKADNIAANSAVSIVVADLTGEVQYEGVAEPIKTEDYESMIAEGRFKKLPSFDKYRQDPTQIYLCIKPTWARFILHGDADQTVEFKEFA
jgi:general stress protein 26